MQRLDGQSSLNPLNIFLELRNELIILLYMPHSIEKTCLHKTKLIAKKPEVLINIFLGILSKNCFKND